MPLPRGVNFVPMMCGGLICWDKKRSRHTNKSVGRCHRAADRSGTLPGRHLSVGRGHRAEDRSGILRGRDLLVPELGMVDDHVPAAVDVGILG